MTVLLWKLWMHGITLILYVRTAKALWEVLDKKYKAGDFGMKKFIVSIMKTAMDISVYLKKKWGNKPLRIFSDN